MLLTFCMLIFHSITIFNSWLYLKDCYAVFRFYRYGIPLSMILAVGLSYMMFLCWVISILYTRCWVFLWMMLNFIKFFFCIYWDDHRVLKILLWGYITLNDLHMFNHPCIQGMNPSWFWCMTFLMSCWNQFASTLFRIFTCIYIRDIDL